MINIVHYSLNDFMMYASEELKRSPRCISAVNAKYREQLEKEYGSRDKIPSYCATRHRSSVASGHTAAIARTRPSDRGVSVKGAGGRLCWHRAFCACRM